MNRVMIHKPNMKTKQIKIIEIIIQRRKENIHKIRLKRIIIIKNFRSNKNGYNVK
jgi:hypothetical protein